MWREILDALPWNSNRVSRSESEAVNSVFADINLDDVKIGTPDAPAPTESEESQNKPTEEDLMAALGELVDAGGDETKIKKEVQEDFSLDGAFGVARERYRTLSDSIEGKERLQARRAYVEARNALLFAAVRDMQADRPERNDPEFTRWEIAYEKYLNTLYDTLIVDEQETFNEVDPDFDAVEGLLIDPFLVQTFGTRMHEQYTGAARGILRRLREPTFAGYEGLFNTDEGGMRYGKRRINELYELRMEVFCARFAESLGYTDTNREEKEKRYVARRKEISRKLSTPEAEGDWRDDYHRRFQESDQHLQNSIALYALPEARRRQLPRVMNILQKVLGKRAVRAIAILGVLTAATVTDVMQQQTDMPVDPPTRGRVDPQPPSPTFEQTQPDELSGRITGARGAIGALDELTRRAQELPWLSQWMQEVYAGTNPQLVRTHAGEMEVLAQELGFLTYMPTFDDAQPYVAFSARLPEGSRLRADTSGMYLRYADGREVQLVMVHTRPEVPPQTGRETASPVTVIGFGNEPGDAYDEQYTR